MADLPAALLRSITWDQGTEMARHLTISRSLGACDAASRQARRELLDLDAGTLWTEITRVVVDGRVIEPDGKTAAISCRSASHMSSLSK